MCLQVEMSSDREFSRFDLSGISIIYHYIQTIYITSLNLLCVVMVSKQIWYRNKQYFGITDIVITRDH